MATTADGTAGRSTHGVHLVPGVLAWAPLGEGPHCTTWAAWSIERWGPVAVKLPSLDADLDRARAALRREVGHLRRLRHPAFPQIFEVSLERRTPYIVLELIEGRPLANLLERGPMSAGDTVRLGLQLSSALRYLHGLGIAHLDLKPDNVMMRGGRALLIDFGAAQCIGEAAPAGPRGTDGYMSPEQLDGALISDGMDVWALGALLYEALTGGLAGDGGRRASLRYRRAPRPLRDLLSALHAPDPGARPSSMTDVLHALSALESSSPKRGWAPDVARGHLPATTSMVGLDRSWVEAP
jgi:eukaryotic-like serine/threonine-protein kinase